MVMDYLRSCYHSTMRPFHDNPEFEVLGRWHFCTPDALDLNIPHLYGASVWDDDYSDTPGSGLGEVGQGAWFNGSGDPRFRGKKFCGPADWWKNGSPFSSFGQTELDEEGYPTCCGPKPEGIEAMRIKEADGAPDIEFVSTLIIDQSTGLKLESTGPNEGTLSADTATLFANLFGSALTQPKHFLPPLAGVPGPPSWRNAGPGDFQDATIPLSKLFSAAGPCIAVRHHGTAGWERLATSLSDGNVVWSDALGEIHFEAIPPNFFSVAVLADAGDIVTHNASEFAEAAHTHPVADLTDAGDIVTHDASEFAAAAHTHPVADLTDAGDIVTHDASEFAEAVHTHSVADITDHPDESGEAILSATHSITSSDGTYEDITGLSVTLPVAGTYLIHANLRGSIQFTAGGPGWIVAKLRNTTDSVDVTDSQRMVILGNTANVLYEGTAGCTWRVTTSGANKTIQLRAMRQGSPTWSVRTIASDSSNGRSSLSYVRVS